MCSTNDPLPLSVFSPGHKFVEFESAPRELFLRDSTRNRMDGMGRGKRVRPPRERAGELRSWERFVASTAQFGDS